MDITFYGQSCFGITLNGSRLLFDPMISGNPLAKAINIDEIEADYILLSHGHADHVADAEQIAKRTGAKIIANWEIVEWYGKKDIEGHPMNIGGKWKFDFGTVKMVAATHSSGMPDGSYGGHPNGFVIWTDKVCFYFSGDTGLTMDMKLIPSICPKLNFAILPIGDNFTMGYEDAIKASDFIDCKHIIGCHFDTFGYIEIDHEVTNSSFSEAGIQLKLPTIGETFSIN